MNIAIYHGHFDEELIEENSTSPLQPEMEIRLILHQE